MPWSKSLPIALFLSAVSLTTRAASVVYETSAKAFDKEVVVKSDGGSSPSAQVNYTNNTTFPLRNIGTTQGSATATAGARSVRVKVQGDGQLNTQLNTGFGVELRAKSQVIDVFLMDASFPDGTPVPSGFFGFSALARGQMDFYGTTTLQALSTAELRYTLSVGLIGGGSDDIILSPTDTTSPSIVAAPLAGVVPWIRGQPISIVMLADALLDAKLEASGDFSGVVEFGNSLDWLGITNVTDGAGNPVASFSAVSPDTKVDWGQPATATVLPRIKVDRNGNSVVFSWPAAAGTVRLESTATLGPGATWATVLVPQVLIGDQQVVTNDLGPGSRFFRLSKP